MRVLIRDIGRATLFVAVALLSSVATTGACTCLPVDSPAACELYRKVDVAFVGRATLVPVDRKGPVRFELMQALKGLAGSDVTVQNSGCYIEFEPGEEYIVFAVRTTGGEIVIPMCWSAVWLRVRDFLPAFVSREYRRETEEAVALVESLRKPAVGGHIFGEVELPARPNASAAIPVDGAIVTLRGGGRERRATTIAGRYEFTGLPSGTYTVSVRMPDGLTPARSVRPPEQLLSQDPFPFEFAREYTRRITISDARGCGYAPFEAGENPDRGGHPH